MIGLEAATPSHANGAIAANGVSNANGHAHKPPKSDLKLAAAAASSAFHTLTAPRTRALVGTYVQCSLMITAAAPFGFAALAYISYPTMVLGKSCKLVPVMIMNVLLYRRTFAAHKYLVVFMVTLGITMFMAFSHEGHPSSAQHPKAGGDSELNRDGLLGLGYLLINLALDGTINSTQDEVFLKYKVTGQQMMFFINLTSTLISLVLSALPLPNIPVIHPSDSRQSELKTALDFIANHPSVKLPLLQYSLTGSLGQLFIYETLGRFGSLTLVYVPS